MRLDEMYYTEEEYKELENELEYVRIIKDSAEKTLKEVREENKKLKSDLSLVIKERDDNIKVNEFFKKTNSELGNVIEGLKEQNKKLKDENEDRNKIAYIIPQVEKTIAEETIKDLQERIRFLEECLDNKEKVNKSLREENKRLSDFLNYDGE